MALATFGVTARIIRADFFPALDEFTSNSNPTSTTVGRILSQKAGELQGALARESVSASAVEALGSGDAAYLWCQEVLSLMIAVRLLQIITTTDPEVAKAWRDELNARLKDLDERGAVALGSASLDGGASPANGPATHISTYSLEVPDTDLMSSIDPLFRKDDLL